MLLEGKKDTQVCLCVWRAHMHSRRVQLLELGDGLRLFAAHEPVDDDADDQREEDEVQAAEERLLLLRRAGGAVGRAVGIHVWCVSTLVQ